MTTRFVELIRVSTKGQADRDTPEIQRQALDRLRKARPGVLVERLEALGVSGALGKAHRADLRRLEELAKTKAFDEIRCYSIDRLTRADDLRERAAVYGIACDAEALIVDATGRVIDPADTSDMGELDFYLHTLFAKRERKSIARRLTDGKRKKAASGGLAAGRPPYGRQFDKLTGQWSVDSKEAGTVKMIVGWLLEGVSLTEATRRLNAKGVPSPGNREWRHGNLARLLRHPSLVGTHTWGGHVTNLPPILDQDTWERAKAAIVAGRSKKGRPSGAPSLLSRILTCGECGSTMYVVRQSKEHDYYVCRRNRDPYYKGPKCVPAWHRLSEVDASVMAQLRNLAASRLRPAAATEAKKDWLAMIADAKASLDGNRVEEEKILRLYRRAVIDETAFEGQLAEIRQSRDHAETELASARAGQAAEASRGLSGDVSKRLRLIVKSLKTPRKWRAFCELVFPRSPPYGIKIYPDGRLVGIAVVEPISPSRSLTAESALSSGKRSGFSDVVSILGTARRFRKQSHTLRKAGT